MTLQSPAAHDPEIAALGPWFHNLHLPDGRETAPDHPLGDFPAYKWKEIAPYLPEDLSGWTALDIGCNAGFYSFELVGRGACVTGLDVDDRYLAQARWAAERFGVREQVEFRLGTVYDLAQTDECWDLILFMGVLYHLRYPLLGLDLVASRVRRLLVLQTLTMPGESRTRQPADLPLDERHRLLEQGWPKLAFLEQSVAGDRTNWWAPNAAGVEAMARSAGLELVLHPAHEIWICRPRSSFEHGEELDAAVRAAPERRPLARDGSATFHHAAAGRRGGQMLNLLLRLARRSPDIVGSPWAFLLASLSMLLWLALGPVVGFSDAWLVFPATATSIGAFLVVFLIQYSQNRDMTVVQLKLDELIRGLAEARTHLVGLEHRSDEELAQVAREFRRLREHHEEIDRGDV
jgi:tRNA (mo5U34)-methyltransferase